MMFDTGSWNITADRESEGDMGLKGQEVEPKLMDGRELCMVEDYGLSFGSV